MTKEERKKSLEKELSEVRSRAAAVNEALAQARMRRTGERIKAQRAAASPLSEKEKEEQRKKAGKPAVIDKTTKAEIIEKGSVEELAALYISDFDTHRSYRTRKALTKEDEGKIAARLKKMPEEEVDVFKYYLWEYNRMYKYYLKMHYFIKDYQAEGGLLAALVAKWEGYDREAENCTKLLNIFCQIAEAGGPYEALNLEPYQSVELERKLKEGKRLKEAFIGIVRGALSDWKDATLIYDEASQSFKADVSGERKLYEQIAAQAKDVKEALSQLKAFVEVGVDYAFEVGYWIMSLQMEQSVEMLEQETYLRAYGGPLKYFRSELNNRKDKGETITPEEEKRAVYPDYYEVEADEKAKEYAKKYLSELSDKA